LARASIGSIEALKHTTVQLLNQNENNLQRMYLVVNAGNNFGDEMSGKISKLIGVKSSIDIGIVDIGNDSGLLRLIV
jgi:hypothetical protein